MTTFQHNGITITCGENGKFTAETSTGKITAPSLDSMKKKLDRLKIFESFDAFYLSDRRYRAVTIVGIKSPAHDRQRHCWLAAHGINFGSVIRATPEVIAAVEKHNKLCDEHAAIITKQLAEREAITANFINETPPQK